MTDIIGLFPTPLLREEKFLDGEMLSAIQTQVTASLRARNTHSALLSHTEIIVPSSKGPYFRIAKALTPKLVEFGELLFGEKLEWSVKEMWSNVLETGGHQAMHTHANSFISGVIYLSHSDPSANTTFSKGMGGHDFVFRNNTKNSRTGAFNGSKWMLPEAAPGDLILFPSYLLHEVPINRGPQRITVSFNAIPERLDSWGYAIKFGR